MKKILLLAAALMMSGSMLFSQSFEKGNHAINLGIGFGHTGYFGAGYKGFIPSVHGSYELGIVEVPMGAELTGVVGVGGFVGWATSRYEYSYWQDIHYVYNKFVFGARGTYHFVFHDKLDTYAGVFLGYKVVSGKWKGTGTTPPEWTSKGSSVDGGGFIGARWFFKPNLAAFVEIGNMISVLNFGVTFKIEGNK